MSNEKGRCVTPHDEPAFPCRMVVGASGKAGPVYHQFGGMTLRDYFAANAPEVPHTFDSGSVGMADRISMWRYHYADAMLRRRNG